MKQHAGKVLLLFASVLATLGTFPEPPRYEISEIARGHTWVSPYWGYNTPKLVFDGTFYYTLGLWGDTPDTAEGILYRYSEGAWQQGVRLPGIYQPATVLLDSQRRVLLLYTRKDQPIRFLRAKQPGTLDSFDELPAPPDMRDAYYVGVATRAGVLYLAYLAGDTYTMCLTTFDLDTLRWTPSIVVCEGQIRQKPKTAWTYPILIPTPEGLHFAASNCPDGGEGNTYNQVWYLFFPDGAEPPVTRQLVAESPVGHLSYAMDMAVDDAGGVHLVYLWNHRIYGDVLPQGSPPEGVYYACRTLPGAGWHHQRLGPTAYAGLFVQGTRKTVITIQNQFLVPLIWDPRTALWNEGPQICPLERLPAPPGFLDVLTPASGSMLPPGPALVCDGTLPVEPGKPSNTVLWSMFPENTRSHPSQHPKP